MDAQLISIVAAAVSALSSLVAVVANRAKAQAVTADANAKAVTANAATVEQLHKWLIDLQIKHEELEKEHDAVRAQLHASLVNQGAQRAQIEELSARVSELQYEVAALLSDKERAVAQLAQEREKNKALQAQIIDLDKRRRIS